MLRIGDFSNLAQVTVRTLRYYDEKGLFKPFKIDEQTGYRYYKASQLSQLNRIITLKELGFSLDEIATMGYKKIKPENLYYLLEKKKAGGCASGLDLTERSDRAPGYL